MKQYYVQNYAYILIFGGILAALNFSMVTLENQWLELLANGGIALALSIVPCIAAIVLNRDFSNIMKNILRKIFRRRVQSETVSDVCNDPKFSANDSEAKSADGENNQEEERF